MLKIVEEYIFEKITTRWMRKTSILKRSVLVEKKVMRLASDQHKMELN